MRFTYLEKYGGAEVRRSVVLDRRSLKPGKWFYLRAPKIFIEKILPKLTHKLGDFANIKRGFTTGANDFFYMIDISHLYEMDYISNHKKFEEWGVKARTKEELETQGLIYIENEGGIRFVINKEDVSPVIRSPKQLKSFLIKNTNVLAFIPDPYELGIFSKAYIKWGEKQIIDVKGKKRTWKVKGYNNLETTKNRKYWFKLPNLEPGNILLPMSWMDKLYIPFSENPIICDARLYVVNNIKYDIDHLTLWLYLNSTIFLMTAELYCRSLGGGASDIKVKDYKEMVVPQLNNFKIPSELNKMLEREPNRYYEEIKKSDKIKLDLAILGEIGFDEKTSKLILAEIYLGFIELVNNRLIKAGKSVSKKVNEIMDKESLDIETFRRIINDEDN